ncbi:MAG: DUF262 domain-containing protein [Fibromonadaceae bacterium]|nr:DUF262 domain-containing protein [Fibromonadaceae bacterium]
MDMNQTSQLVLKSVNQLSEYKFFIPAYQRGYRWTDTQVTRLLDDIWQFSKKEGKKSGEFYCLQPIVVKQKDDKYEVIDGQQRFTTIFLIIKFLEDLTKMAFKNISFSPPYYETREDSSDFLDGVITKTKNDAILNIDYFHIWKAYCTIKEWFESKEKENNMSRIDFVNTLLKCQIEEKEGNKTDTANNVRVIWYEINETENNNSIDIFTRLNIGKIPLTNAELIKALFLQKGNFEVNKATLKQIQIASEWDTIEKTLQDDAFWFFIYDTENPLQYDNRIEYIFDLMKGRTKESQYHHTFDEFYKDFSDNVKDNQPNIDKLWLEIKKYFLTFEDWFRDYELFHYIGYLVDCGKNVNVIKNEVANKTKVEFKNYLKTEIKKQVNCNIDDLKYGRKEVRKILLLFNIQTVLKTQKSDMRFPFHKYKSEDWDIEHICSQTDKTVNSQNRLAWIDDILEYFTGTTEIKEEREFTSDSEVKAICNSLIELKKSEKIEDDKFNVAFGLVQKYFREDSQTEDKDDISNLALLDSVTNRRYGNSFFPIKRKRIVENDKTGIFVPIATKNLFLKYYSKKMGEIMYWTSNDASDYLEAIKATLEDFLPKEDKQ